MPTVTVPVTFTYMPDDNISIEENMDGILNHIRKIIGSSKNFVINVNIFENNQTINVNEMNKILEEAIKEAKRMESISLHPEAIDKDGEILYRQVIKKE